jgi:hypothetical protein
MNYIILNQYGISFIKQSNGNIKTTANSKILNSYLYMLTREKNLVQELVNIINLVVTGTTIPQEDKEWSVELGLRLYTGIVQNNLTFDLFLEDHYNETLETFPLSDIKEIMESLLEFLQS